MARGRIRDDDIAAVRDRSDIVDVLHGAGLELRRAGNDSMKALCPFHDERTPSFHVTPSKGQWYCHGCGEGGDVIGFVQRIDHVSFPEAVRSLADTVGVAIDDSEVDDELADRRRRVLSALADAADYFHAQLDTPAAAPAVDFLRADTRRFTRQDSDNAYCGYAPADSDSLLRHLSRRGHSVEDAVSAGLARLSDHGGAPYPTFRGRLMWPIADSQGRVIGFGARRLSDGDRNPAKYVNSAESSVYRKSEVLYGWNTARRAAAKAGWIAVVEGYTDQMAMAAAGMPQAVATCGTAFGAAHLKVLLRGLPEDTRIVFAFDGDAAGGKAAARSWDVALSVLSRTYAVRLPAGLDPCELRATRGDDALTGAMRDPQPLTRVVLEDLLREHLADEDSPEAASRAAAAATRMLERIPDPQIARGYAELLTERLRTPVQLRGTRPPSNQSTPSAPPAAPSQIPVTVARAERTLLRRLLTRPAELHHHLADLPVEAFITARGRGVAAAVHAAAADAHARAGGQASWIGAVRDQTPENSPERADIAALIADGSLDDITATHSLIDIATTAFALHDLTEQAKAARAALATLTGADQDHATDELVDLERRIGHTRSLLHEAQQRAQLPTF